jgi:hypothetical protein
LSDLRFKDYRSKYFLAWRLSTDLEILTRFLQSRHLTKSSISLFLSEGHCLESSNVSLTSFFHFGKRI